MNQSSKTTPWISFKIYLQPTVHLYLHLRLLYLFLGSNVYGVNRTIKFIVKAVGLRAHYIKQIGAFCKGEIFIWLLILCNYHIYILLRYFLLTILLCNYNFILFVFILIFIWL